MKKKSKTLAMFKEFTDDGLLPSSRLEQSEIFGVRESTLNCWMHDKELPELPEYAKRILLLLIINSALNEQYCNKVRSMNSTIPVGHGDKILLIKLKPMYTAVYAGDTSGDVIAECTQADDAAYIMDFIN